MIPRIVETAARLGTADGRHEMKAIITGATGMAGEGVLIECLHHPQVRVPTTVNKDELRGHV